MGEPDYRYPDRIWLGPASGELVWYEDNVWEDHDPPSAVEYVRTGIRREEASDAE